MRFVSAEEIDAALDFPALIDALEQAFLGAYAAPPRHHHVLPREGEPDATHLLMPAWGDGVLGVKIVNVFPGNGARGLSAVQGVYVLQNGRTGETMGSVPVQQWKLLLAALTVGTFLEAIAIAIVGNSS